MSNRNGIPVALIALALAACGEGPTPPGSSGYACTPDPERLAQRIECVEDDACPCGAHCDLGLCVADCASDLDCASGACDAFGRCRDDGETALVPPPPATIGTLVIEGDPVDLIGDHLDGSITLSARGAAIEGLRVAADAPLSLRCAHTTGPDEIDGECTIDRLAPEDGPIAIGVGLDAPVTGAAEGDVRIFSGGEVRVVHVRMRPSAALVALPLEGVFTGRARIAALGLSSRTATLTPGDGLAALEVPISLEIHAESGGRRRVTMRDELGIVFPDGAVVGELLRGSDGSYRMEHGAQRWVGGDGTLEADVVASAQSTTLVRGRSGLSLVLRTRFDGIVAPATSPFVDWEITATRQGDLAAGATPPALPTSVVARDPIARAASPFAIESTFETQLAAALATATSTTDRVETVACTPLGAVDATRLADALPAGSWSGDLRCSDGAVRTLALQEGTTFDIARDAALCFGDLDAASSAIAGTSAPSGAHDCVDGARLLAAIAMATDADRRRALGEPVPNDLAASALGHRYLQEWLHANAFVARQGAQIDVLNDVLDGVTSIERPFLPTTLLELENEGWELLLHPRLAMALLHMAPRALHAPDYRPLVRPGITIVPDPREDQGVGLPVAIDRAAAEVLDVHRALLERARYVAADRAATEASAQRFARSSFVLHLVGAWMHELVRLNVTDAPAWEADAESAEGRYGAALGGILRQLVEVRRGANPLGIDDEIDLPLYRVGDEASALDRFSALTDFLLGTPGTDGSGIAEMRVARAETALATAQDAWARSLERDFASAQLESEGAARLEAIERRYGEDVLSLCGDAIDGSSLDVLEGADAIDPETCYVRPACRPSDEERLARMGPGDAAFAICIAALVRDELGDGASGAVLATGFERAAVEPVITGARTVRGLETSATGLRLVLDDGTRVAIDRRVILPGAADVPAGTLDAETISDVEQRCSAVRHSAEAARPDTTPTSCAVHADCPAGLLCTSGACTPDVIEADAASCYTGAIGERVASIRAAATDVDIARSELAELGELYDRQMQTCILQELGADQQIAAMESHNDTMQMYGTIKLAADVASNAAGAVKDCASAAAGDTTFGIAAGVACGAAGVEAVADSVSDGMQFAMDEAERAHEVAMARIAAETDAAVCTNEAEMTLVGTRTATLRIARASQELARLMVELENAKADVASLLDEGELAVRLEQDRTLSPMEIDFWLGSAIEEYSDAFRAARRAVYLAAIALEYEYQASLSARGDVLSATRVADLRRVVEDLRDQSLPGTIGASPSELTAVVSLRTELLRLADRTGAPEGEHQLDDVQRFRALLASPRHAAYDESGRWIGQRIPFRIVPAPAIGVADADGIAIYAGADCAERLWSVRAALVGDGVITGSDTTRTRLEVRKRNTFFSQWCTPRADRGAFQIAATRPSRNLFLDPFSDFAAQMLPPGSDQARAEADAFASARLMPLVGVTRGELESEGYADGGSIELAGRGLYGDYEIFLPAEMLAVRGAAGVDLAALDDVLLRLDYVSVARSR